VRAQRRHDGAVGDHVSDWDDSSCNVSSTHWIGCANGLIPAFGLGCTVRLGGTIRLGRAIRLRWAVGQPVCRS
jgi:hypothetical protein